MHIENVKELMKTLKKYDLNVWKHSIFVMNFSYLIMEKIHFPKDKLENILIGSLLHDIGKLKLCKSLINKPGKLNNSEWNEIKKHPVYGVSIISQYESSTEILPLILYHHERWDGQGYLGLKEKDIYLGARIIAIADSVEAMSSNRPYQKAKETREILMELLNNRGVQFDPYLINSIFEIEPNNNQLVNFKKLTKEQKILEELIAKSKSFNPLIFRKNGLDLLLQNENIDRVLK